MHESQPDSHYNENERLLEDSDGNPIAVMNSEFGDIVVMSGILQETDFEARTMTLADINMQAGRTFTTDIPGTDIVLVGADMMRDHLQVLRKKSADHDDVQAAVVALSLQARFPRELGELDEAECEDCARRVLSCAINNFELLAPCVFDAPEQIKSKVLRELSAQLRSANTLYDITSNSTLMAFIQAIGQFEGISELEATQRLLAGYGN